MSGDVKTGASYRHGDLKPANILWFKPKEGDMKNVIGTLKICDWGEAKNKAFATVMRHSKTTADKTTTSLRVFCFLPICRKQLSRRRPLRL